MVLHGGSGIIDTDIQKAIFLGIRKININTELRVAYTSALKEYFAKNPAALRAVRASKFEDAFLLLKKIGETGGVR